MVFPILWYRLRIPSGFFVVVRSRSRAAATTLTKRKCPLTPGASTQAENVLTDAQEPDVHDVTNLNHASG